jgi:hypothetical protein
VRRTRHALAAPAVALAALVAALAGACDSGGPAAGPATTATPAATTGATGGGSSTPGAVPAVWPLPADASAAAAAAGLPMLGEEKLAVHYHAHLDLLIRGTHVQVPANIGIDRRRQKISPLHTHDATGVVHIESAEDVPFTLGQVFAAWGQPLSARQVGPVTVAPGEQVRVYRNGSPVSGDLGALRLAEHNEIVVWLGPATAQPQVPRSYDFPPGA